MIYKKTQDEVFLEQLEEALGIKTTEIVDEEGRLGILVEPR